jgi:hypothetical protein
LQSENPSVAIGPFEKVGVHSRRAICSASYSTGEWPWGDIFYKADHSGRGRKKLGFPDIDPAGIQKMDAVSNIPLLLDIGRATGKVVDAEHFAWLL